MSENGFPNTAATLRKELAVPEDFDAAAVNKYKTLLQKKWTTTARLQRKASQNYRLFNGMPGQSIPLHRH
jgi:platelet-activating factor acetylhydrolase IB subunit alpha